MKILITSVMILGAAAIAHAQPGGITHVAPADAEFGKQLELVAQAPPTTPKLVAQVRTKGETTWQSIELVRRDDASWVAIVPATTVTSPGLEYYLLAGDQAVFATPEWPHALAVNVPAEAERRGRDMLRHKGRRSRVTTMGEWIEFGGRKDPATGIRPTDHFYRFDADFSYRLWTYPLEEIRVGYTRLIGDTLTEGSDTMVAEAGFKVAGWFELGLAAVEGVRVDGRMIVMATQQGFAVGGRGEARLGDRDQSHVALGVEYLADVGSNGFFRLGWGTVPKVPMSATVEITNLPASYRDTGVRLYYDVAVEVAPGVRAGLRVGYAARNQLVAGFTGGAGAAVEF
jgi:hypothetical protein